MSQTSYREVFNHLSANASPQGAQAQAQMMSPLLSQDQFETEIWTTEASAANKTFIVYFTSPDCIPCTRLDLPLLQLQATNLIWYKCDISKNKYTAPFCGVRGWPTFLCIRNKKIVGQITSSLNEKVADWLYDMASAAKQ